MHSRIAVGFDGTERAEDAIVLARSLAGEGAEITMVGILPSILLATVGTIPVEHGEDEGEGEFERRMRTLADHYGAQARLARSSSPARGLYDTAAEIGAELVVVGSPESTNRGRARAGRVASQLLQGGQWAVALAPTGHSTESSLAEIGVAVDGSTESQHALREAIELASGGEQRSIRLIGVASITWSAAWAFALDEMTRAAEEETEKSLEAAMASIPEGITARKAVRVGDPPTEILDEASREIDLLCMGSRAYGPVRRVLLGSVSSVIVREAPCAVLVEPRGEDD